jgi:hypothetical protein
LWLSSEITVLISVKIDFPTGPPIYLEVTHPRVFYLIGFLLTSISKRDAMGRKPRRKVFAVEGLKAWEKVIVKPLNCITSPCRSFTFLTVAQVLRGGTLQTWIKCERDWKESRPTFFAS